MSIDYYLVDRRQRVLFEVGTHKHEFARTLRAAIAHPDRRLHLVSDVLLNDVHEDKAPTYTAWLTQQIARIQIFAEDAGWNVALVSDCDDSLFAYNGCIVRFSVYDNFRPYRIGDLDSRP